jgi:hypothetical protein
MRGQRADRDERYLARICHHSIDDKLHRIARVGFACRVSVRNVAQPIGTVHVVGHAVDVAVKRQFGPVRHGNIAATGEFQQAQGILCCLEGVDVAKNGRQAQQLDFG